MLLYQSRSDRHPTTPQILRSFRGLVNVLQRPPLRASNDSHVGFSTKNLVTLSRMMIRHALRDTMTRRKVEEESPLTLPSPSVGRGNLVGMPFENLRVNGF